MFSHEEGEFNCTLLSTDETTEDLRFFPNPASDYFNIEGIQENAILQIRDLQGRLIQRERISGGFTRINLLEEIISGIYLEHISNDSQQFTHRIVIE